MEVLWNYEQSAAGVAGSGVYLLTLPAGAAIDTAKLAVPASTVDFIAKVGDVVTQINAGQYIGAGTVYAYNTTQLFTELTYETTSGAGVACSWSSTCFSTVNANFGGAMHAVVPINGW